MASLAIVPSFDMLEDGQYIALVVLGSLSSFFSMIGSGCVLHMSFKQRQQVMHRLMFALSISDLFSSTSSLFMHYSVPSFLGLPGAVGNHGSCSTTGFFLMTFIMVGCTYNAYLSLYLSLIHI